MSKKDEIVNESQRQAADEAAGTAQVAVENGAEDAALVELRDKLEQARGECDGLRDKYLRSVAELENTRRRADNEVSNARRFAVDSFAQEMLSVRDSLELARAVEIQDPDSGIVSKMQEGLELTLKQMDGVFAKFAIEEVSPQPGDKLDPERHQAMTIQETNEVAPNHIVTVIQKGYLIHDRLLRPALVIVAKAAAATQEAAAASEQKA